jgi:hypothetical protein
VRSTRKAKTVRVASRLGNAPRRSGRDIAPQRSHRGAPAFAGRSSRFGTVLR